MADDAVASIYVHVLYVAVECAPHNCYAPLVHDPMNHANDVRYVLFVGVGVRDPIPRPPMSDLQTISRDLMATGG